MSIGEAIRPNMSVLCSENVQFGVVDHIEGSNFIKLRRDQFGQHHYIPFDWVVSVENSSVKVDRPGYQAKKEWITSI